MMTPEILITAFREIFTQTQFPREPEPTMVMDEPEHVEAFRDAGAENGPMAGNYLFNAARATQALHGAKRVVDLGCGPARFLCRMAKLNPEISFLGLDLSDEMLANAKHHLKEQNIQNVELRKCDITDLNFLEDHSVDGVMSTVTLHHLPTMNHLRNCFREVNRVLTKDGGLYLVDLGRMKSLYSIMAFAYRNARNQPHAFTLDSERSWRAAFLPEDFRKLSQEEMKDRGLHVYETWLTPIMMVLKSADRELPPEKIANLKAQMKALDSVNRQDVKNLNLFFRLGGLKNSVL
jgi:arsenite methyltransferase